MFSRICIDVIGRNGRKRFVFVMLSMLLKLELVVILMYFIILVKVCCFFNMFWCSVFSEWCSRMKLVVCLVMFIVLLIDMLMLVVCSGGVLLMLLFRKFIICLVVCSVFMM